MPIERSPAFADRLLQWFDQHGRRDLPWQHPRSAYRVWLSEIMLQQTQVATVVPYFRRFVDALPDLRTLAAAPPDQVLALWSGLGYYARARNLKRTAELCIANHQGRLPDSLDALVALPGIGRSTAGAILALAHGLPFPILDGNVRRVLARHRGIQGWPGEPAVQKLLWKVAADNLPGDRLADYTQAQMDLGSAVCTRSRPRCDICPLRGDCIARISEQTGLIPAPRPRREMPRRECAMLLLQNPCGEVLLQRRAPVGIWSGLWSLPQFDDTELARTWLCDRFGSNAAAHTLEPVRHVFTHFELSIQPLQARVGSSSRIGDNEDLRWTAPAQFGDIGLPAPVRALLNRIGGMS